MKPARGCYYNVSSISKPFSFCWPTQTAHCFPSRVKAAQESNSSLGMEQSRSGPRLTFTGSASLFHPKRGVESSIFFFFFLPASSSSPHLAPDLERARPQTSGEEELQLQLALAMSREESEKVSFTQCCSQLNYCYSL